MRIIALHSWQYIRLKGSAAVLAVNCVHPGFVAPNHMVEECSNIRPSPARKYDLPASPICYRQRRTDYRYV